jgi:hypothetical protein
MTSAKRRRKCFERELCTQLRRTWDGPGLLNHLGPKKGEEALCSGLEPTKALLGLTE